MAPMSCTVTPRNYTLTSSFLNQLQTEWNEFLLEVSHSTPVVNVNLSTTSAGFLHNSIRKVFSKSTNESIHSFGENLVIPVPLSILKRLFSPSKFNGDDASKIEIFNMIKKDPRLTSDASKKLKKLLFPDSETLNEISDWPSPDQVRPFRHSAPSQLCPKKQRKTFTQLKQRPNLILDSYQTKTPVSSQAKQKTRIVESELNNIAVTKAVVEVGVAKNISKIGPKDGFGRNKNITKNEPKEQQYSSVYDLVLSCCSDSTSLFYDLVKHSANGKKGKPTIVFTYFSHVELAKMYQIVKQLGYFKIENAVTSRTTHLICGTFKKTMNLCKAVVRGCWILDKNWIFMSADENRWLMEERFEMSHLWPTVKENRLKRQEYGKSFRCDIFEKAGSMYISKLCTQPTVDDLKEVITLAGGNLVNSLQKSSHAIGPIPKHKYIKEVWILNCILQGAVIDTDKYLRSNTQ